MTELNNSVAIAAEIETLRRDLATVTAAIHIMGKSAIDTAKRLEKDIAEAQAKLTDALSNELLEAQKARLANFSAIRVDWDYEQANILVANCKIIYTRMAYDSNMRENIPREYSCNGFAALDDAAYEYLVTVRPDAIPAPIMALAPNDPHEALSIYMAGKARGYLRSKAA